VVGGLALAVKHRLDANRVAPPIDAQPMEIGGRTIYVIDQRPQKAQPVKLGKRKIYGLQQETQTVVLLHGSSGSCWDFEPIIPGLAQRYRVVVPERPGMGWSDQPDEHRLAPMTETVYQTLRTLGVERPILVGWSYGGSVALQMAADHPGYASGLVLLAAAGPAWTFEGHHMESTIKFGRALTWPVVGPVLAWTVGPLIGHLVADSAIRGNFGPDTDQLTPEFVQRMKDIHTRPSTIRAMCFETTNAFDDLALIEGRLSAIDVPTLVVSAELDTNVPPRVGDALAEAIPGARHVLLLGTAHGFPASRPEETIGLIDRLAAEVAAPAKAKR
jgi:pimeloyl-ACP methyl ester carboxylesterase